MILVEAVNHVLNTTRDVLFISCWKQDRISEAGAKLSHLMMSEGAYVYVCGDGNAMAQGVHHALIEVLMQHGGVPSKEGAEAVLKMMKARNRYVLDVWS